MDFSFLANEAKAIHMIFTNLYYGIVLTLIVVTVVLEFFKLPLGQMPTFIQLIPRAFISAIMLATLPEVLNYLSEITDKICAQVGQYTNANLVLDRMGDHVENMSFNLMDIKKMVLVIISFLSFYLLYWSVYLIEALFFFAWIVPYIFSPILIACYVVPRLSHITETMYAGFIKVCTWKLVWGVLATLLWTAALHQLEQMGEKADILTLVFFNLILAFSLLKTPKIADAIFGKGIGTITDKTGLLAAGAFTLATAKVGGYVASKLGVTKPLGMANRGVTRVTRPIREPIKTIQNLRGTKQKTPEQIRKDLATQKKGGYKNATT